VSGALLLTYWALHLPVLGQELTLLTRQYPGHRNVTLRLLEPLGAREEAMEPAAHETLQEPASATATPCQGIAITLEEVSVRAAGHTILTDLNLTRLGRL
jgi:ATP-binding cassette subfamily B protein